MALSSTARRKPNIVLFGVDSLRADHMSCYGYPRLTTPHIDRFASQGTLFERTISAHIPTTSAYSSMLTGRDVDADEAERIGLVSGAVPEEDLLDECYRLAEQMAAFSRPGIELTKRTLWSGLDAASLEGHMQAEGLGQLFVRLLTANFEEAVAARAEKRPAVFTDDK